MDFSPRIIHLQWILAVLLFGITSILRIYSETSTTTKHHYENDEYHKAEKALIWTK